MVTVRQVHDGNHRRIIKVEPELLNYKSEFELTSKSSSPVPIYAARFNFKQQEFVLDIHAEEWIKFDVQNPRMFVHYSNQMLDEWFPASEFGSVEERFQVINKALGCKIVPVKLENLVKVVKSLVNSE